MKRRAGIDARVALLIVLLLGAIAMIVYRTGNYIYRIERQVSKERELRVETPEQTVRQLMIALARHDQDGVRRRILPNPDANLIWEMSNLKDESESAELFASLPVQRLAVGDTLGDPFTPSQRVTPAMIGQSHLILTMHTKGKDAWTFFLVRSGDEWRVDMNWYVDGIKRMHLNSATRPAG